MGVIQTNQTGRGRQLWAWALGAFLVGLSSVGQAKADPPLPELGRRELDRIVATVNGSPLTQSELEFEARVALVQRGGMAAANLPLDSQALRAALEYAIGQRLQAAEAEKLSAFELEEAELGSAVKRFEEKIGGRTELTAFLRRHEMDLAALSAVLSRELRAERLLDSKIRLRAQVNEGDLRRYYQLHAEDLPGDYEQNKAALKDRLTRERYQQLAVEALGSLRKGADVRVIGPLAKPSP